MQDVRIIFHGRKTAPEKRAFPSETPEDNRYGFWGMVTELRPENHTVHVRTPEGRVIPNVRVSSNVWVTIDEDKGFLSGRRYLPPVDTHVLVFMPNGHYSSAVIIASGFSSDPQHSQFMGDSDEEKEIDEGIENSGWKFTEDKRTGTRVLQNKPEDPAIKLEIDQEKEGEEKVTITIHGNIFTVDKDSGIKVETDKKIIIEAEGDATVNVGGDAKVEVKGDASISSDGDMEAKANGNIKAEAGGDAEIKGVNVKAEASGNADLKGTNVTVDASAVLTLKTGDAATFMPNIVPACPFGMPHGGPAAGIVKLKGG